MRRLLAVPLAAGLLAVPSAQAASPASLPTVTRTLSAAAAVPRICESVSSSGARGLDGFRYRAPLAGYVSARLAAPDSSDWDLVAIDGVSGRRLSASQSFGSHELVQTWTTAGQIIDFVACRRHGAARSARLSIDMLDATPPPSAGIVSVVRVKGSKAQLAKLDGAGLDVTESRGPGWADVLVAGDAQRRVLAGSGLTATTRVADLDAYARRSARADAAYTRRMGAAGSPMPSGRTTYRTYDDVQADLKKLAEEHPDMVRPVTLGTTFQGREIQGVEIADDVKADDGRPTFFLMGTHHAREWPSEEAALEYAFMLVNDRADPRIAALLRNERTTVVPVVNVDGFVSTVEASAYDPNDNIGGDPNVELAEAVAPPGGILAYRRKNCDGELPSGDAPCALQWGIDNNRNYGNLWGGEGGSPDPTSQSFKGPAPRSEPETQAVWNYSRTHQVTALMTLHTIAALVLRPPGLHDAGKAPDEQRMKELGDAMGKATAYTSQYSFQLYDTAGTTEDDTYAAEGGYGYTIEMGPSGGLFHMPYETGVVTQWERGDNPAGSTAGGLREALLLIAEAADNPADHGVISGTSRPGAVLRLKKSFDTKTSPYCDLGPDPAVSVMTLPCAGAMHDPITLKDTIDTTTTVPASGQFEWHVNPSTRPFVGGGALIQKLSDTPSREDTFTGGGASPDNQPTSGQEDREFTITPEDHADAVKIDVSWGTPEDYDVEVYRKNADGSLTKVGSSGNQPGTAEEVVLSGDQAAPGTYVLRVVNFAAVVGTWTAKVGRYTMTTTTTTGHPEAYTLTCEVGGQAVATRELFIGRGQRLDVDPCGTEAPATLVGSSASSGAGVPAALPAGGAVKGAAKKRAAAKKRCATAGKRAARKGKTKAHGRKKSAKKGSARASAAKKKAAKKPTCASAKKHAKHHKPATKHTRKRHKKGT